MMSFSTAARIAAMAAFTAFVTGCYSPAALPEALISETKGMKSMETKQKESVGTRFSLAELLDARAKMSADSAPVERREAFQAGINAVRESGIETSAKQVGDAAIDDDLIGWDGKTVKLSELWSEGPVVLMWYRGGWCPFCNIQLRAMQRSLDEITEAGARLVVLTPEMPEKAKETADANDIDMVAFHDRDNHLAEKYGIMFDLLDPIVPIYRDTLKLPSYNGSKKLQLPLAATYVIDQSGTITYAFLDADYKKRAAPTEVVAAVKAAASEK